MSNTRTKVSSDERWHIDDGAVTMEDQAQQILENEGTNRQWVAIGIHDKDGFAEVVALAHPANAPLIAAAPELLTALEILLKMVEDGDWTTIELDEARAAIAKATRTP